VIRVKVCGVTRPADARIAAELGAAAIGLLMWPRSPRYVDVHAAREIVASLPPFVLAVGVFVNQPEAESLAEEIGLDVVQLHGDESPDSYRAYTRRVIKMVPVNGPGTRNAVHAVPAHASVLLDAHDPARRGGTGLTVDWSLAADIAAERPVILSGGLNAENVGEAIRSVRPFAIDVSSGVESAPGVKDPDKLRAFFAAVRTVNECE
jgi:phosphoribosylanthranilate isomerase